MRPVFCLIVLGDARGHETGKQGNRSANPGLKETSWIFARMVLAASTTRSAMSRAVPAQPPHAASLGQVHRNSVTTKKRARPARRAATFTPIASDPPQPGRRHSHRRRSAPVLGLNRRRRRHGDHRMTGNPAASCSIRFGSEARTSRFRSALARPHSPISASEQPHPVQWAARASSAQTSMHGDFRLSAAAASRRSRFRTGSLRTKDPRNLLFALKRVSS